MKSQRWSVYAFPGWKTHMKDEPLPRGCLLIMDSEQERLAGSPQGWGQETMITWNISSDGLDIHIFPSEQPKRNLCKEDNLL